MSDATMAEIAKARRNWKDDHLGMYLRSGGAEGHIVDVSDIGGHKFTTTLLLRVVGRKSGKTRINPLIYGDTGGEVVIVASKGGADHHPAWYLNIKDSKEHLLPDRAHRGSAAHGESPAAPSAPRSGSSWWGYFHRTKNIRRPPTAKFRW